MGERPAENTDEAAEPPAAASAPAQTPAFGRGVARAPRVVAVDGMPADRSVLARMAPEQRSAIYLNQIRKMMIFFVVLTAIGIVAGVIIGIVDINAVSQTQQCTGFGC